MNGRFFPIPLEKSWLSLLKEEFTKSYIANLAEFLEHEWNSHVSIYPPKDHIFEAFKQTPVDKVKAVIIGQDPYHNPQQAHGLSFSVLPGTKVPPSLKNIFKEMHNDIGCSMPNHGCLLHWAQQGVLMLNAILTVRQNQPRSHYGKGWEQFTDAVVKTLNDREDSIVFILWGKDAQQKAAKIKPHHLVLKAAHPSPYAAHAGFFGCRHFSKANEFLVNVGKEPIDWQIPSIAING